MLKRYRSIPFSKGVKLRKKHFKRVKKAARKLLVHLGKPLFLTLIYALVILYLIGHIFRIFLENLIVRSFDSSRIPKFNLVLPKVSEEFRRKKIILPKLPALRVPRFVFPVVGVAVILFLVWFNIFRDLPSPTALKNRQLEVSTKILDRNGVLLYQIYKNKNRTPVELSATPSFVRSATLAAEDAEFYSHAGFSLRGITRALLANLRSGNLEGGSTITQQLVKNALLTPERTVTRKIKEIVLSVGTELTYSKDDILEMYLNEVAYGGSAYGIEEAAKIYFNKDVQKLTLAESALLAGLPKSPTTYSPFGANPELAMDRQKEVLRLMEENGFITKEERTQALEEKIAFAQNRIDIKAPHFVMYIKQQLAEKYGEDTVESGGLTVTTSLDYNIQKMAEEVVKKQIDGLRNYHVTNGAAVVMDPNSGEILAMVGSKDYFDTKNDGQVNVTTQPRQPGSSIKPVTYAYALGHGFTPATIIPDKPIKFEVAGQPTYIPQNYDNKFRGDITLRSALAESRNIPALRILNSFGVDKLIDLGRAMGITTWKDPSQYGLSLTLGGGETKLLDLANVYSTIANYGKRPAVTSILKVTNFKGSVLETAYIHDEEVFDARVAYILIDILKDNYARSPAFGSHSALVIPRHPEVAVKTGTSNNYKDNLTVGFNQKYLTAVWVGNNDGRPMSGLVSGVTGAAPIWNGIMSRLLAKENSVAWKIPDGMTQANGCYGAEWFLAEARPRIVCPKPVAEKNDEDHF